MDDLALSFTATRDLDAAGEGAVLNVLATLPLVASYITGGAVGGDVFIGRWLFEHRPEAKHHVIIPADRSRVDYWWLRIHRIEQVLLTPRGGLYRDHTGAIVEIIHMPAGTTYEDRNAELVHRGTAVCGFPARIENDPRSRRSGTWQTISMARRVGKLHRWDTVTWPFTGCVERSLRDMAATRASENTP